MPGETVILDPTTEDAANVQINVTDPSAGMWLTAHDYPAPELDELWASSASTEGERRANRRYKNRTITLTVRCREALGTPTIAAIVSALEQKIGKLDEDGGTLERTIPSGETIVFDILGATIAVPSDQAFAAARRVDVTMTFTAAPFGRGAEIAGTVMNETTAPAVTLVASGLPGDVLGSARLVVTEGQVQGQRFVVWGQDSTRDYPSGLPQLLWQAEGCTTVNTTVAVGPSGASGTGNNALKDASIGHTSSRREFQIASAWVGLFRILARVQVPATNTGTISMRMVQQVGQSPTTASAWVPITPAQGGVWRLADFGVWSVPQARKGVQAALIQPEVISSTGTADTLWWDWVLLVPVGHGGGQAKSSADGVDPVLPLPAAGNLEISSDGVLANNSGQTTWGVPVSYEGDYLTVPPSGLEDHTIRIIVKASRGLLLGDTGDTGDTGTDDISAQLFYTPRYLVLPAAA